MDTVDTPQQNNIANEKNRHLLNTAQYLMSTARVPQCF